MGFAEEKVQEIKHRRQQQAVSREWLLERNRAIARYTPELFDSVAECVIDIVARFSKGLPCDLQADRQSPSHLFVHHDKSPIVKLNIHRGQHGYLVANLADFPFGFAVRKAPGMRFKFCVDEQLEPCFTDGTRQYHPQEVAEKMLERVFLMFG